MTPLLGLAVVCGLRAAAPASRQSRQLRPALGTSLCRNLRCSFKVFKYISLRSSISPRAVLKPVAQKSAVAIVLLGVLVSVGLLVAKDATAATNSNLNFQARLLSSAGAVVPDGDYNIEFKIYDDISAGGQAQGTCSGNCLWKETRTGADKVRVVNGYFSVNLGSVTAFGSLPWDQTLYFTMRVGGTGGPSWEASEMTESGNRIQLTGVPYAFRAGTLAKTSSGNTGTLSFNTVANSPAITLPDASGTVCLQSASACGFESTSGTDFIRNQTSLQTANFNIQSAASGSIAGLITGAAAQSVDIFQVKADSVASPLLSVGSSGAVVLRNSSNSAAAFQVQTSGGVDVLTADTSASKVKVRGNATESVLGSELASGTACSGTNWSGTGPWTHTPGSTTVLDCSPPASVTASTPYQVVFTVTGMTTGSIYPVLGGAFGNNSYVEQNVANETEIIFTSNTNALHFTPSSDFDGAISAISVKQLTYTNPVIQILNADGTVSTEIRSGGTGGSNTFVGQSAGLAISSTGTTNSAFGASALTLNTTGGANTATGGFSLGYNTTGSKNTANGAFALENNTVGSFNTAQGYAALLFNSTGQNNTAVGYNSGLNNIGGSNNTYLGAGAGYRDPTVTAFVTTPNLQNAAAIGYGSQVQASNVLSLGGQGAQAVNVGIGTTSASNTFSISPDYYDTGTASTSASATVVGSGTTWTSSMVGMEFIFANGNKYTITGFTDTTHLTLSASSTNSSQAYRIHNPAFFVSSSGQTQVRTSTNNVSAFQVQNQASRSLFNVDTSNSVIQVGNTTDGSTITLVASGNANGTIRKKTIVTSAVTANDVVIIDTANAGQVTTTTSANSNKIFGVATATNGSGVAQDIVIGGVYQVTVDSTTTVNIGDFLVTSATAGQVTVNGSPSAGTVIGRALSSHSSGSSGLVWATITPAVGGGASTGVSSIGTIDSQTKSANGAVISGNDLILQTADATHPGLVSDGTGGTQTFAGAKTFTGATSFTPSANNVGTLIQQTSGTATSGNILDVQGANGTTHFLQIANSAANEGTVLLQSIGATRDLTLGSGSGTFVLSNAATIQLASPPVSTLSLDLNGATTFYVDSTSGAGTASVKAKTSVISPSYTGVGAVSVSSGGSSDLTLNSASATIKIGSTATALQKAASAFTLDVSNGGSNSTLTVSNSGGAGNITLQLDSGGSFAVGASTGVGTTCSGGQVLQDQVVVGGITTGGTCTAVTGGGDSVSVNGSAATDANFIDTTATGTVTGTTWNLAGVSPSNISVAIGNASDTVAGAVTTNAQNFAGDKTFYNNVLAHGAATGTTGTSTGTGTNTTTLTLTTDPFSVGDVVFINNAGQDYYTRITVDPADNSYTVDPAVSFDNSVTVTKYTIQNVGATASDYTTQANRFFQGYFLGGVVAGAGSTVFSDANVQSATNLRINTATGVNIQGTNVANAFQVQTSGGTSLIAADTSTNGNLSLSASGSGSVVISGDADTGLVFSGSTTDITTGSNEDLTITPNGSGNVIINTDTNSGLQVTGASDSNIANNTIKGLAITSGAITENTAANTGTYVGADITTPALTLTTGTALNAYGLRITTGDLTQSAGTIRQNGILIDSSTTTFNTGGILDAISIKIPSIGGGTYHGLKIGNTVAQTWTAGGTQTGIEVDLMNNLTATGIPMIGIESETAGDSNIGNALKRGLVTFSGSIIQNTGGATGTYIGVDAIMPAFTLTSGTALNAHGLRVTTGNLTQTAGTLTENGIYVDSGSTTFTTGGTLNGINVNVGAIAAVGNYKGLNISTNGTARTFTAGASITGINLDLNSNVTANGVTLTGLSVATPADTAMAGATKKGLVITSGALTVNTASTGTYVGNDITIGALTTQTNASAVLNAYGLRVTTGDLSRTNGTLIENGIYIDSGSTAFLGTTTLNAINVNVGTVASSSATYKGINISTNGVSQNFAAGANITGLNLDLNSNISATSVTVTGLSIATPADTNIQTALKKGLVITSGNISQTANSTGTYVGADLTLGALTANSASAVLNAYGLRVTTGNLTQTNGTITENGIYVDSGATTFTTGGTLNGINVNVGAIAAVGTYKGLNISTNGTARTFTAGASITGINLDLANNITATGASMTGIFVNTPADSNINNATKTGISISSGGITQISAASIGTYNGLLFSGAGFISTTTAAGTLNWNGAAITMANGQTNFAGSSINANGLKITTGTIQQTSGTFTENGIYVDSGSTSFNTGGTLNGINLNAGDIAAVGTYKGLNISTNGTARTFTAGASITGINLDLNSNVTADGVTLTGMSIQTAADTAMANAAKNGLVIDTGALTQITGGNVGNYYGIKLGSNSGAISTTTAAGSLNWIGIGITVPNATANFAGSQLNPRGLYIATGTLTQTAGTLNEDGIRVDNSGSTFTTGGTLNGINVNVGAVALGTGGTYNGLNISTNGVSRTFSTANNQLITGINLDLSTNVTSSATNVLGMLIATPADTNIQTQTKTGLKITSGNIIEASGSITTYVAEDIVMPNLTTNNVSGATDLKGYGLKVKTGNLTVSQSGTLSEYGLYVDSNSTTFATQQASLTGLYIDNGGTTMVSASLVTGVNLNVGAVPSGGSYTGLNISTNGTARTFNSSASAITGIKLDLNSNVTANGVTLTGMSIATPGDATSIANATKKGLTITSGSIIENTAANTGTYLGADITMPALTLTSGTALNSHGLRITTGNLTQSAGTLTENGIMVDSGSTTFTTGGRLNALNVAVPTIGVSGSYFVGLNVSTNGTSQTISNGSNVWGVNIDLNTSTIATGQTNVYGLLVRTPTDSAIASSTKHGIWIDPGNLTQTSANTGGYNGIDFNTGRTVTTTTAAGTLNWNGGNFVIPDATANFAGSTINANGLKVTTGNLTQTAGTLTENGLKVDLSSSTFTTGGSLNGLQITPMATEPSVGTTTGINVGSITTGGQAGSSSAISIGTGWDTSILGAGALNIATGANGDINLNPNGTGNVIVKNTSNSAGTFQVQNSGGAQLLNIDTTNPITDITNNANNNLVTNGSFETNTTGWALKGSATISRSTAQQYIGNASLSIAGSTTGDGAFYNLTTSTLASNTKYSLSLYARMSPGVTISAFQIGRADDGATDTACLDNQVLNGDGWAQLSCTFTTATTSGTPYLYVKRTSGTGGGTVFLDGVQLTRFSLLANASIEQAIAGNWALKGSATVSQDATQFFDGTKSLKVVTTTAANDGTLQNITLNDNTLYSLTFYAKLDSASSAFTNMEAGYSSDGSTDNTTCITAQTVLIGSWQAYTCSFLTPSSHSGTPYLYIKQTSVAGVAHTFYLDTIQLTNGNPLAAYREGQIALNGIINSPMSLQNQTDSTTAFQIQNASGANLVSIDSQLSNINLLGVNDGQTGPWTNQASNLLPAVRQEATSVTANGYVYVLGGYNQTFAFNTVFYAKLNADGSTGAWTNQGSNLLPANRMDATSVVANGYAYVLGGCVDLSCTSRQDTVFYAKLNADGSTGAWTSQLSNKLPAGRSDATSIVANGYVYILGGINTAGTTQDTVYYAKLNADGSTGAWTDQSSNKLPAVRRYSTSVVANGYVYVLGGYNGSTYQNTVYYAKLNSDGSTGAWTNQGSNLLPNTLALATSAMANGYVYVMSGYTGTADNTTVYYAKLNADGSTGAWTAQSTNSLPGQRRQATSVVANAYIYVIGGRGGIGLSQDTIFYTSTSRLKIGGSVDLVGFGSQDLTGSGSSGTLTAGNTTIIGSLDVRDLATFNNVSVNTELDVSGSTFLGGTLTFNGVATDITTGANEALTIAPNGTGDVVISADADSNLQISATASPGVDMVQITNSGQGVTTTAVDGLEITFVQADDADATDTNAAIRIAITSSSGDADTLYGLNIDDITGGSASETGLRVGTGWDEAIRANGIVTIGAQTDTASTGSAAYSLTNSAAGTFGAETNRDKVASSVVYKGKLFVSTGETNLAGVYRYDGGTTWTLVTSTTLGKAVSGDSAADADAFVMTVFNGKLWIGSQTGSTTGSLYYSTTADTASAGDNFTLVNSARGTFASASQAGVQDLAVYNGNLIVATQLANLAEIDRYDGGTVFSQITATDGKSVAETTADKDGFLLQVCDGVLYSGSITGALTATVASYQGNGTTWLHLTGTTGGGVLGAETNYIDITGMACWSGSLYVAGSKSNAVGVYYYKATAAPVANVATNFLRINTTVGKFVAADGGVLDAAILRVYNGRLYAGAQSTSAGDNVGALYEYPGIPTAAGSTDWTLMTGGARGTFGAQTNVDSISVLQEFNGTLYVGTDDGTNNVGSVYTWSKLSQNSFGLRFDSGSSNYGSISFVGDRQSADNNGHYGSFLFSNAIQISSAAFDYAEDYQTFDSSLQAGEPVAIESGTDHVKRAAPGDIVIGVVSKEPGFRLSSGAPPTDGSQWIPIALTGRVPVRVYTGSGAEPIKAGDKLSLLSPGVLHKAAPGEMIVGAALADFDGEGVGQVSMFVHPEWSSDSQAQLLNGTGLTLQSADEQTSSLLNLLDKNGQTVASVDNQGNAYFAGTITADKIKANQIEGLQILTDKINSLSTVLSANTGGTAQSASEEQSTGSGSTATAISLGDVTFQNATVVLDLNVMGPLIANGSLTVKGDANFLANVNFGGHITTSGDSPTMDLGIAAGITVAAADNLEATLATANIDGSDTSGQVIVNTGDNGTDGELVSVTFKKSFAKPPKVFLTAANGDTAKVKYYITTTSDGFKIVVTDPITSGTKLILNYFVVQ